jgi:hypothetical protein
LFMDDAFERDGDWTSNRFIKPSLEYTFGPKGTLLKAALRGLDVRYMALEPIQASEVTADAFALFVTTTYAQKHGISASLLWDVLLKLFEFLHTLELVKWCCDFCPQRNPAKQHVITFKGISTTAARASSNLRLLKVARDFPESLPKKFCSYWTENDEVQRVLAKPNLGDIVTGRLHVLDIAHRRAFFEIVCPAEASENVDGITEQQWYQRHGFMLTESNLDELGRHKRMPDEYWSDSALSGTDPEYEDLDASFIGTIHALRAICEVRWNEQEAVKRYGRHYLDLCGEPEMSRVLSLIRRPRSDVIDQCVHFPPKE